MSSTPPPFQPQTGQPYGYPPRPPIPIGKKTNPLLWILGVLVLIAVLAVAGIGYYFATKVKQAGVNSALFKDNPALAGIKVMAALNPNIEIVSMNEDTGKVIVRDKQKDKTYTVDLEDAKKGRFTFQEDGKDPVTINTTKGENGSINIDSGDGKTVRIGGSAPIQLPAWLPEYPGSQPKGTFSAKSDEGNVGNFTFTTADSKEKVTKFYDDALRTAGLTVTRSLDSDNRAVFKAESDLRKAAILIGSSNSETTVNVTFTSKK